MAEPRLLFLVSTDFGELSTALDLLRGTTLHAKLLLPRRMFEANAAILGVPALPYETLNDVLTGIDAEHPDIVFLFSGYLYAINALFDLTEHEALLTELGARGLRVLTSDPFFGLLRPPGATPFSKQHPAQETMTRHFERIAASLRNVTHLYLGPADSLPGKRKLSAFNPTTIDSLQRAAQRRARIVQRFALDPARARWLFVLSAEDYSVQVARMGRGVFEAMLGNRLADAARASRQPVLIAPRACVDAITTAKRTTSGLIALPFCRHDDFTDLVLDAEQVFYWNMLSHSLLARMVNRLPVCFFDHGHMSHAIPALLPLAIKSYFSGVQPALHDPLATLDSAQLARNAQTQIEALDSAVEHLRACPAPSEIVERVMRDVVPTDA